MLYPCLRSHLPLAEQDPLSLLVQRLGGWMAPSIIWVDYWVPEDRAYLLYTLDPLLEPLPRLDYVDHRDRSTGLQRGHTL